MNLRTDISEPLHRSAIHLLRQLSAVDKQSGLSSARLSALSVIAFAGPLSLGELAGAEQVSAPTMTKLVQALVDSKLISVTPSKKDSRQKIIRATNKGTNLMLKARDARLTLLDNKLKTLNQIQLSELAKSVKYIETILS